VRTTIEEYFPESGPPQLPRHPGEGGKPLRGLEATRS
jgi:hypothetical protein